IQRLKAHYQKDGLPGVARAAAFYAARRAGQRSPVPWAWFGPASLALARALPPLSPPVLVLSLPRSGSSWVGETLGQAANALYLREPLTQTRTADESGGQTVFPIDPAAPPRVYGRMAARSFAALPAFKPLIVQNPGQWSL